MNFILTSQFLKARKEIVLEFSPAFALKLKFTVSLQWGCIQDIFQSCKVVGLLLSGNIVKNVLLLLFLAFFSPWSECLRSTFSSSLGYMIYGMHSHVSYMTGVFFYTKSFGVVYFYSLFTFVCVYVCVFYWYIYITSIYIYLLLSCVVYLIHVSRCRHAHALVSMSRTLYWVTLFLLQYGLQINSNL